VAVPAEMIGLFLATNCFQEFVLAIAVKLKRRVYHTMAPELTSNLAPLVIPLLNSNTLTIGLINSIVLTLVVWK
jgi:hypothetical protein